MTQDGGARCWGDAPNIPGGAAASSASGANAGRMPATAVTGMSDVAALAGGKNHLCALTRSGTVRCVGDDSRGQLGDDATLKSSIAAVEVRGLADAIAISTGDGHTCAVRRGGGIVCWGENASGQLGIDGRASLAVPSMIEGVTDAISVAAGRAHTCILRKNGGVVCLGDGGSGQLGDAPAARSSRPIVLQIPGATAISARGDQTCAATREGVYCWGAGVRSPRKIEGLEGAVEQLAVGADFVCARQSGGVKCAGNNDSGQLGDGTTTTRAVARAANGIQDAKAVIAGDGFACSLDARSRVSCWGANRGGALGQGAPGAIGYREANRVVLNEPARSVATGAAHSCALMKSGMVMCWGNNTSGQTGSSGGAEQRTPVAVAGLRDAIAFDVGAEHSCAVQKSGAVTCWGNPGQGRLGRSGNATKPAPVDGIKDAVEVAAGGAFSCVRHSSGKVTCFGDDSEGQLGGGPKNTTGGREVVSALNDAQVLRAGDRHACAVTRRGSSVCWGSNTRGQIGNGTSPADLDQPVPSPVTVVKLDGVSDLRLGKDFSCAVHTSGKLSCWGDNRARQLGTGTQSDTWTTRVPPQGISAARSIGCGDTFVCAGVNASLMCWGSNEFGQLGERSTTDRPTPVPGPSIDAASVAGGAGHACAVDRGGAVWCWGDNRSGQVGDGGIPYASSPVAYSGI